MHIDNLIQLAKDTDNLLGNGLINIVLKYKLIPNVYFEFELNTESNAIEVERLWKKAFKKLSVIRVGNLVTAG